VIVSDIRGVLPLFSHHLPSIVDARERLLAPGGVVIPQTDTLWAAVAEAPESYKPYNDPWSCNPYGLDMTAGRAIVTNSWSKRRIKPEQLLAEPKQWVTLDYRTVIQPNVRGDIRFTATRAGTAHGLGLWFDTTLVEGVGFSNSPAIPELIYGNAFLPWP